MVFDLRFALLLLACLSAASGCSLIKASSVTPSPESKRCFAEAHRFRATTVVVKGNGDCLLCRNEEYKCSDCVTYEREMNARSITKLLMRTRAESNANPYDLFTSNSTNPKALDPADLAGSTTSYKSPLFNDVSGMGHVIVELLLANGTVAVKLKFAFTGSSLRSEGNWFRPQHLRSAFPWSVEQMKADSYNIFKITGQGNIRKFMINRSFAGCGGDRGYLMISKNKVCKWEKRSPHAVAYLWTSHPETQMWNDALEAIEFRISGDFGLDADDRVYTAQC